MYVSGKPCSGRGHVVHRQGASKAQDPQAILRHYEKAGIVDAAHAASVYR